MGGGEELASNNERVRIVATYSETRDARLEELRKREEKIFDQRDEYERKISEVIGSELSSTQLLQLKQLFADIERCEQGIERIQERMDDIAQAV